jgi:hypothetical protein
MPMTLKAPGQDGVSQVDELYILKNLENFGIRPVDPRDVESVIVEYDGSNPEEQAGSYPGMEISFKHPKTWDEITWEYTYQDFSTYTGAPNVDASFSMEELTNPDNLLELEMGLNQGVDETVSAIGSSQTADYIYNLTDNTYTMYIAQDIDDLGNGLI